MEREVTLEEMLAAREERARCQWELLRSTGTPVISFCMNIAGPVKSGPAIRRGFREGLMRLEEALRGARMKLERMERATDAANDAADDAYDAADRAESLYRSEEALEDTLEQVQELLKQMQELKTGIAYNVDGGSPYSVDQLICDGGTPFTSEEISIDCGTP